MLDEVLATLDGSRDAILELQRGLVSIPALGPENGGQGERKKADFLRARLEDLGVRDVEEYLAPDERVACGHRPNLAARISGRDESRTFWVVSHMDVVPPGDLSLWNSEPFELKVDGDLIYGRGVEDNHQGIASSLSLAQAVLGNKITPPINLGLMLVSDEETGSAYGLDFMVRQHADLFGRDDLFLVPDYGHPDSTMIEIAEKSMLWLKVIVKGRQCHASTPKRGVNSLVAASAMIMKLRRLYEDFPAENKLFEPAGSTFEPTKKEANVPNVNTIPGQDVFYVDCRVLPEYDIAEVVDRAEGYCREIAAEFGAEVVVETPQREQAAPATARESDIVLRLESAVHEVYGVDPKPVGVGGGTVAAVLRKAGLPAAVWSTILHNAHQPNEHARVSAQIGDAKVMAGVLFGEHARQ
jgi:succinyl-diaminopimelate desuccinylase